MDQPASPLLHRHTLSGFNRDDRQWPLARVKIGDYETADFAPHFDRMVKMYERGPAVVIYDVRHARLPTTDEVTIFSRFIKQHRELLRDRCLATAVVTSSSLQRGVLGALQWITPFPIPLRSFSSMQEGEVWVRTMHPDLA